MRDAATVLEIIREPATRTSTLDVPHGNHGKHWRAGCHGKRARPVRRGAVGKGPALAGTSLAAYPTGTAGSGRGPLEKMTCMREGDPLSSAHAWCAVISFQEHEEASRCLS